MRRVLAVTAVVVLLVSLLGTAVLADRGGRGVGRGNTPQSQGPAKGPARDHKGDQEQIRDQTQQRDQDCQDCDEGPVQERKQDAKQEAKEAKERAGAESAGNGTVAQGNAQALQQGGGSEGDDEAPKPGNGNRPETPPGQGVSAAARSRFTNEGEDTENVHRVRMQLEVGQLEDSEGNDDDDEVDDDEPQSLEERLLKWQRKVQQSAKHALKTNNGVKPFMLVGQPEIDEDGNLSITVWKGNQIVRDHQYPVAEDNPIVIAPTGVIRLVDSTGVTTCDLEADPGCLETWLDANPDAYVSVWGRVVTDGDDTSFVAYRITVTVPDMETETPTKKETIPAPTIPAPTATPTTS